MSLPKDIHCYISGCHYFVSSSDQNIQLFNDYCRMAHKRLDKGNEIAYCLHCQPFTYAHDTKSILVVQIVECFDPSFFEQDEITEKISINFEDGLILLSPFTPDMINNLSQLLSHNNVRIITYDLFNEIPLLLNEGIKIKLNKILDGNYTNLKGLETYSTKTSLPVKYAYCRNCKENYKCINSKKIDTIKFFKQNGLRYYLNNTEDPFKDIFTCSYWNFFSKNCAYIAISFLKSVENYSLSKIAKSSKEKLSALNKIQEEYGPLGPYLKRHYIINKGCFTSEFQSKSSAYRTYVVMKTVLGNFDIYNKISLEENEITRDNVEKYLADAEAMIQKKGNDDDDEAEEEEEEKAIEKKPRKPPHTKMTPKQKKPPVKSTDDDDDKRLKPKGPMAKTKKQADKNYKKDTKKQPIKASGANKVDKKAKKTIVDDDDDDDFD